MFIVIIQKTICQADSKWSAPGPTCSRVSCGALDAPANGRLECTGNNKLFGTKCEAICNEGFKLTDGDRIRICESTTMWSGEPAQCTQIKCELLSAPKHGRRLCSNSNLYGSKCRFVCEIGYEFHGDQERICQADEQWSGEEASCTIKECVEVPKPKKGDADCSNGYKFGSLCRYDCNSGFDLEGARENFCGSDGEWSVSEAPNCIIGECSPLDPPVFGDISCSHDNKVGSKCSFTCNTGYELLGDEVRLCEDSHIWSGVMPRCVPTECPVLTAPKNGMIVCTAERAYRSICQFDCNDGYELKGNKIMECSAEKKWNPEEAPVCEEILCDPLPKLPHGNVKCSDDNRHQSVCRFVCEEGYRIKGSRSSICSTDGSWSADMPVCDQIRCDVLSAPDNGSKDCSGEIFGETCNFACNTGFDLSGSELRTCQADGTWTGVPVHCTQASCGLLPAPRHGKVTCSAGGTFGSTCDFECDTGYSLVGSKERTCEADHAWSGSQPFCLQVTCDVRVPPANGYLTCAAGNQYLSICTYSCKSGFTLKGEAEAKCGLDGEWSSPPPTCNIVSCPELEELDHGRTTCSDSNNFGSRCFHSCNLGYELKGSATRDCLEIGWSGKAPTCELIRCPRVGALENGSVRCTSRNKFGSECSYSCDAGYMLLGPKERRCGADHEWSGSREPVCALIRCGVLDAPFHGSVNCENSDFYGSECTFTCARGYSLEGSDKRTCGVRNGVINNSV